MLAEWDFLWGQSSWPSTVHKQDTPPVGLCTPVPSVGKYLLWLGVSYNHGLIAGPKGEFMIRDGLRERAVALAPQGTVGIDAAIVPLGLVAEVRKGLIRYVDSAICS